MVPLVGNVCVGCGTKAASSDLASKRKYAVVVMDAEEEDDAISVGVGDVTAKSKDSTPDDGMIGASGLSGAVGWLTTGAILVVQDCT